MMRQRFAASGSLPRVVPLVVGACVVAAACSCRAATTEATEAVIAAALPPGWNVVERRAGQFPWGHHWCGRDPELTGVHLTVRGPEPSWTQYLGPDDRWRDVVTGAEALEIFVMPGDNRERWMDVFCHHRPLQPARVAARPDVRIYARPGTHMTPDEKAGHRRTLAESKAVRSPASPANDPSRLTWKSWQADLEAAIAATEVRTPANRY